VLVCVSVWLCVTRVHVQQFNVTVDTSEARSNATSDDTREHGDAADVSDAEYDDADIDADEDGARVDDDSETAADIDDDALRDMHDDDEQLSHAVVGGIERAMRGSRKVRAAAVRGEGGMIALVTCVRSCSTRLVIHSSSSTRCTRRSTAARIGACRRTCRTSSRDRSSRHCTTSAYCDDG
jgi:hypothetical protein